MNKLSLIKILHIFIAANSMCVVSVAQNVPDWYNESSRKLHYPDNIYYTGMAYADVKSSEGAAVQNAEQAAKTEALSKILVTVKSRTTTVTASMAMTTANGLDEQYVEQFSSFTNIDVAFKDVPGMQCQHYRKGSTVTAFAYVNRADLARYYDRQITSSLTKIETALDNADELIRYGEKIKARTTAQAAVKYVADLDNAQRILLAVSNNADPQSASASALTKRLVAMLAQLKNSTAVYLDCKTYIHSKSYSLFSNELKGILSKIGCNFVSSREQTDWVVSIEADIVRENQVGGAYFIWIDGAVAVRNNATSQVIYNGKISSITDDYPNGIKGAHTAGYDNAAVVAYKEAAKIIGNKITEILRQ